MRSAENKTTCIKMYKDANGFLVPTIFELNPNKAGESALSIFRVPLVVSEHCVESSQLLRLLLASPNNECSERRGSSDNDRNRKSKPPLLLIVRVSNFDAHAFEESRGVADSLPLLHLNTD